MFKKIVNAWNAHGAATCTALSIGCVVVEGVWAYRAGKRAGQHPEWTTEEKIMNAVGPAATGAGAIVFAVCAQRKNMANLAMLAAEKVMDEKKRQKWLKNAKECIGEENLNKIKQSMHPEPKKEEMQEAETKSEKVGQEMFVFVDDTTGAKTIDTVEGMLHKINSFQARLHSEYIVTLGEWLAIGGFERFKKGELPLTADAELEELGKLSDDDLGWCMDTVYEFLGTGWMDVHLIECKNEQGQLYYLVEFEVPPLVSVFHRD